MLSFVALICVDSLDHGGGDVPPGNVGFKRLSAGHDGDATSDLGGEQGGQRVRDRRPGGRAPRHLDESDERRGL